MIALYSILPFYTRVIVATRIMNKSVNQMCRVCMSAGSRNIFKKSSAPGGIVGGSDAGGETSATNTTSITTASNNNNNSNNNPSQSQTSMLDNCSSSSSASSSVSSLEKLLEKLRYVTLIKVKYYLHNKLCQVQIFIIFIL